MTNKLKGKWLPLLSSELLVLTLTVSNNCSTFSRKNNDYHKMMKCPNCFFYEILRYLIVSYEVLNYLIVQYCCVLHLKRSPVLWTETQGWSRTFWYQFTGNVSSMVLVNLERPQKGFDCMKHILKRCSIQRKGH